MRNINTPSDFWHRIRKKMSAKFMNSEKLRIWDSRNLLDSPRFLKDFRPWVHWKSTIQKVNLPSPLWSLGKAMKNDCKLDYIPTGRKITSSGKLQGSWFRSLFLQQWWFHLHTKKWPKNVELWCRNRQCHCICGVEKCWNHIEFVKIWHNENSALPQNATLNYMDCLLCLKIRALSWLLLA